MYRDPVELKKDSGDILITWYGRARGSLLTALECSLFGLLNRTVTKSGGSMLRRWMLTPLVNSVQINARLNAVAFFTAAENDELRQLLVTYRSRVE